jgi:hypothetical protein
VNHDDLDALLEQAIAIAAEAALGDVALDPFLVALPARADPAVLFVETRGPDAAPEMIRCGERDWLACIGAAVWLRIGRGPGGTYFAAAESVHGACGVILQPRFDGQGRIAALDEVERYRHEGAGLAN